MLRHVRYAFRALTRKSAIQRKLEKHFSGVPLEQVVTAARTFPVASRVDVQIALEEIFAARPQATLIGIYSPFGSHETPTLAPLFAQGPFTAEIGPLQHDDVDVGEAAPIRCLKNGLWLAEERKLPFAVLLSPAIKFGTVGGVHVEVAVPRGEDGLRFSQAFLGDVEARVSAGRTYRGRVISLEAESNFTGSGGDIRVHRLKTVRRDEVILPERTLRLLNRNVMGFINARTRIKDLALSGKKGILFYGPPGTGKTHTIHYLASQLTDHTILLITGEQAGLIEEYFRLARFLQPAMVVIEDVDLIARAREESGSAGQEALLNKLLNEMDGLREDVDILFILTTNHPDQLEPALASRPGRIDQAIEFPLPDEEGRSRLIQLYSRGVTVPEELMKLIVRKTKGASPAFIKELMRRSAQFQLEIGGDKTLQHEALDGALEEMLFSGGSLNVKLLGGSDSQLGFLSAASSQEDQ
jgi:AAA+ superfamily predicted ATPase